MICLFAQSAALGQVSLVPMGPTSTSNSLPKPSQKEPVFPKVNSTKPVVSPKVLFMPKKDLFKKPDIKIKSESKGDSQSGGGWGSSGGGSGVACFANADMAREANQYISKNHVLPQSLIDQITELTTLDYWEWKQGEANALVSISGKSLEEIVYDTHKRMAQLVPLFIFRLQQAGELIEFKTWSQQDQIPRIDDANPTKELPENCKLVQLAARFAKERYSVHSGPAKNVPLVRVELNQVLFEKLDLLNQAILIIHEQLYLLGQMTGYKTSDKIRSFVMTFFVAELEQISAISEGRYNLRIRLMQYFGDYLNYFGEDLKYNSKPFTQESRFNSFYALVNTLKEKKSLCEDGKMPQEELVPWRPDLEKHSCQDYVMNPASISKWATDEMIFTYLMHFVFDLSFRVVNAEDVLTPFQDEQLVERSQIVLKLTCNIIRNNHERWDIADLPIRALRYCEEAIRLSPMEKDQN